MSMAKLIAPGCKWCGAIPRSVADAGAMLVSSCPVRSFGGHTPGQFHEFPEEIPGAAEWAAGYEATVKDTAETIRRLAAEHPVEILTLRAPERTADDAYTIRLADLYTLPPVDADTIIGRMSGESGTFRLLKDREIRDAMGMEDQG